MSDTAVQPNNAPDPETLRLEIPEAMQSAPRWLVWRYGPARGGKPPKLPHYLDGSPRRGTLDTPADMSRWGTFEAALTAWRSGRWNGLGFALGLDDTGSSWQGIDLDHTDTRPELAALVDLLPGYVEWSPSAAGVHAIGYGQPFQTLGPNRSGIEAYAGGRYFTVTGAAIGGDIADLSGFVVGTLARLHTGGTNTPAAPGVGATETRRIPEGTRNRALYDLGCSLRARDRLTEPVIAAALLATNAEQCDPPLSAGEVQRIATSVCTKPAGLSPEAEQRRRSPPVSVSHVKPLAPDTAGEPPPHGRPLIFIRAGELARVCDEGQAALEGADCDIYRQGSRLIRIGRADEVDEDERSGKREPDAPILYGVSTSSMVDALSRHIEWRKWDARSKNDVATDPPTRVADIILSREGEWHFPRLIGYTECPCMTPNGRLIAAPGYDALSGLMVLPHPLNPSEILRSPLPEAGRQAVEVLREWLSTFTFATDADESAALAGALTATLRRPLPSAPAIAITASTPATGKSRLGDIFGLLATGRKPAYFTAGHTPEELEKRLDAMLMKGDQVAVLDNLERPLKSDSLCSTITQATKSVRVLGASRTEVCPTNTTLILTGNNLVLLGDLQRRALLIRLDAGCERPEERVFTRDALTYTRARRAALLHAALTLPLAYFAAGCPDVEATPYGSFEDWDTLIRRPLIWAGMPDPLAATVSMRDEDHELVGMRALYPAWFAIWGDTPVTPSQVIEDARKAADPLTRVLSGPLAELVEALQGVLGDGPGKVTAQALGYRLRTWQGRILDGYQITRAPRSSGGVRYVLDKVASV